MEKNYSNQMKTLLYLIIKIAFLKFISTVSSNTILVRFLDELNVTAAYWGIINARNLLCLVEEYWIRQAHLSLRLLGNDVLTLLLI